MFSVSITQSLLLMESMSQQPTNYLRLRPGANNNKCRNKTQYLPRRFSSVNQNRSTETIYFFYLILIHNSSNQEKVK